MSEDKKDKIIYGLIIAVFLLLANFLYSKDVTGLFNKSEQINIEDQNDLEQTDDKSQKHEAVEKVPKEKLDKKVYISGEIKNPGVYEIEDGERLEDLIKKAGGMTDQANDKTLNLAERLEDQMKIYIPNKNEDNSEENNDSNQVKSGQTSVKSALININTASKEELMTLPNIGDKRAESIIEYRKKNRFEKIEDVKNIRGIGDKYFEALKDLITV